MLSIISLCSIKKHMGYATQCNIDEQISALRISTSCTSIILYQSTVYKMEDCRKRSSIIGVIYISFINYFFLYFCPSYLNRVDLALTGCFCVDMHQCGSWPVKEMWIIATLNRVKSIFPNMSTCTITSPFVSLYF